MNILIADSGSTKTDWCFIRDGHPGDIIQTPGLNPYFLEKKAITDILDKELAPYIYFDKVDELYFYGAGLGNPGNRNRIEDVLNETFEKADITVDTDMMGAARSLFSGESGIAVILGTGSNSCYFHQGKIAQQYPSLGYVLGDEGSGSYLGKLLLQSLLNGRLPEELQVLLGKSYPVDRAVILDRIYHKPMANKEIASYVPFLSENRQHPFLHGLIRQAFQDFFHQHPAVMSGFEANDWRFTGSIAHSFSEELHECAQDAGIRIRMITKSPVLGLIDFHTGLSTT